MNKQQLASKIWEAANRMRSKIEANEYKDYILGFMFYKFLSDKELEYMKSQDWTEEEIEALKPDEEDNVNPEDRKYIDSIIEGIGYFIYHKYLFSTWIAKGADFSVGDVQRGLKMFSSFVKECPDDDSKRVFDNIFHTLETGLSKLGDTPKAQTKAIRSIIQLIDEIPMDDRNQDYDVLGFVYEYLISNFAANAGKKAGEFYTPHEVAILMSEIVAWHLKAEQEISIYDPTSGSGSLLITIGKAASKHLTSGSLVQYYAQELKENTFNLTRMNLVMRGVPASHIKVRNADTLDKDWPQIDPSNPDLARVDAVVSNPPYSQRWEPEGKENNPRFHEYGLAPKSKADYAFLLHDLYHIKSNGIVTIVLPHGVLFRGGEEYKIRKNLIERNNIDAIIGLPPKVFFGTGIPTIIMVLKKDTRQDSSVMIIDASKGFEKDGKMNKLRAKDIRKIFDAYVSRSNIDKFSRLISKSEIVANEYNLNISRYVDSSEPAEPWDIYSIMFGGVPKAELEGLKKYWNVFPKLYQHLFKDKDESYTSVATEDIKATIETNEEVVGFKNSYKKAIEGFDNFIDEAVVSNVLTVDVNKDEELLYEEFCKRIKNVPLVDKYDGYQIIDDNWHDISNDVELIQKEGLPCLSKVDPNMVVKKKKEEVVEVQEGWKGRVLPFDLIQEIYFATEKEKLNNLDSKVTGLQSQIDENINSILESEDLPDSLLADSDNDEDKVDNKKLQAYAKQLRKRRSADFSETDEKIIETDKLLSTLKKAKSDLKKGKVELEEKIKDKIETLSEKEAIEILEKKWTAPIMHKLGLIADEIITDFTKQVEYLGRKYQEILSDVSSQIETVSKELDSMLGELEGNEFDMLGLEAFRKILDEN